LAIFGFVLHCLLFCCIFWYFWQISELFLITPKGVLAYFNADWASQIEFAEVFQCSVVFVNKQQHQL